MKIYELLDTIKRRPGAYIGYHSPTHLHSFISGYYYNDIHSDPHEQKEYPDFGNFHDWVANKLGYFESTSGWAYMIEDQRKDKEEALWLFFQLLDVFRGFKPKILATTTYAENLKLNTRFYSRFRKVWGTLKPLKKPRPIFLTIEEVLPNRDWVALYAKDINDSILDRTACENLEHAIERAIEIFGVGKSNWKII